MRRLSERKGKEMDHNKLLKRFTYHPPKQDQPNLHVMPLKQKEDRMKKLVFLAVFFLIIILGCSPEADVASYNLSKAADQFQIERRIVFYNGITADYILVIEGRCSLGNFDSNGELTVTCKTGENLYKKHFLGLSDNVTYFAEQLETASVSKYRYKVIFKPTTIVPDIDLK